MSLNGKENEVAQAGAGIIELNISYYSTEKFRNDDIEIGCSQ